MLNMALETLPKIAKMIGVGKSTLSDAMHHMPDFPKPNRRDGCRRYWNTMHIASWIVKHGGKENAANFCREKMKIESKNRMGRARRIYETGKTVDGSAYCIPAPSDCIMLTNPDLLAFTRRKLVQHEFA